MNNKTAIIVFILTSYLVTFTLLQSHLFTMYALGIIPGFTALLLILLFKNKKQELINLGIFNVGHIKWYLISILLPFIAITLSYFAGSAIGLLTIQTHLNGFTLFYHFLLLIFTGPLPWAIGEEIGWRGFLQPKLTDSIGINKGIFLTGVIWAVWHYIFIFFGGYFETGNVFINTALFTIAIVLMSFTIGWIRLLSKSVWPCVFFHAASNAAWQIMHSQFKVIDSNYIYISGETGVVNILFWGMCLLWGSHLCNLQDKS